MPSGLVTTEITVPPSGETATSLLFAWLTWVISPVAAMKTARRVTPRDARHLQTFRAEYGDAVLGGLVLYGGEDVFWLAEGILAAPWWKVI